MDNLKNLNIDGIIAAVIADDADAAQIADSLKKSLQQAQAGEYSIAYTPHTIKIDGYHAVISYDPEIELFRGKFVGLNGGADFYAATIDELHKEAAISLKTFLDVCQEKSIEPRNRSKSA